MRKRMDRYINDALQAFAEWYVSSDWIGKERDCVNIFASKFLAAGIEPGAAIHDAGQIRIECAVQQPLKFRNPSAAKDLVIWDGPLKTTWDETWKATHQPRAIIEWKNSRTGRASDAFDAHDVEWLSEYTKEYPKTFGFLVSTHATKTHRQCMWAQVRRGIVGKPKTIKKVESD
jgi:hypothetical protein